MSDTICLMAADLGLCFLQYALTVSLCGNTWVIFPTPFVCNASLNKILAPVRTYSGCLKKRKTTEASSFARNIPSQDNIPCKIYIIKCEKLFYYIYIIAL